MTKRQVEVFVAGCPVCEPTVRLVQELAGPDCEVTVHDLRDGSSEAVARYSIKSVPAVVVDGVLAPCCQGRGPDRETLIAAGIGRRL
jgi:hypothetical protein